MPARGSKVPVLDRLANMVKVDPETGCHEWQGSKSNGYGRITIGTVGQPDRKTWPAHRLAYSLAFGDVPQELSVCHKCDNRCCINVEHLFLGTAKDNADDREAKGRGNPAKGSKSSNAKLNEEIVLQIRKMRKQGVRTFDMADQYDVHVTTIRRVLKGTHWSQVQE